MAQVPALQPGQPPENDWKHVQSPIEELYINEGKSLKEVMRIMRERYRHCGTVKQYKVRLKKWKFKKNKVEAEWQFILHKKKQRDARGKKTKFKVNGRHVIDESIQRKLKEGEPQVLEPDIRTPSNIWYGSPSPTPTSNANTSEVAPTIHKDDLRYPPSSSKGNKPLRTIFEGDETEASSNLKADSRTRNELHVNELQLYNQISKSPMLLPPDYLLSSINTFFNNGFQIDKWVTHEKGYLTTLQVEGINVYDPVTFFESVTTATDLFKRNQNKKATELLGQACDLVKGLLEAEQPRTVDYLLNAYLHLLQEKREDILKLLRKYVSNMASVLNITHHPWGQIMSLLADIPIDSFKAAILQAWQCTDAALERHLTRFHRETVQCYLEYIPNAFASQDEIDRILRQRLAECSDHFGGVWMPQTLDIMVRLINNLCEQHRYPEAEAKAIELYQQARAIDSYVIQINALELAAKAQFSQNKEQPARDSLWAAIKMIEEKWGLKDPCRIHDLERLESWSREWGNQQEADRLHEQINQLVDVATG